MFIIQNSDFDVREFGSAKIKNKKKPNIIHRTLNTLTEVSHSSGNGAQTEPKRVEKKNEEESYDIFFRALFVPLTLSIITIQNTRGSVTQVRCDINKVSLIRLTRD